MSFLSNAFGTHTTAPTINFSPTGFNAGGLFTKFQNGNYVSTPSAGRTAAVGDIANTYGDLGNETAALRSTVTPGYNQLLQARLDQLNNTARASIGDLRQNLQARRILGSSFGQDTLTRANAEFGMQRDQIVADNFIKSLAANNELLNQEFKARTQQFQTGLDELNLEAGVASKLTADATSVLAQNARTQAQLDASNNQFNAGQNMKIVTGLGQAIGFGAGGGFGGTTSTGASPIGSAISPAGSNPFMSDGSRNILAYGLGA